MSLGWGLFTSYIKFNCFWIKSSYQGRWAAEGPGGAHRVSPLFLLP